MGKSGLCVCLWWLGVAFFLNKWDASKRQNDQNKCSSPKYLFCPCFRWVKCSRTPKKPWRITLYILRQDISKRQEKNQLVFIIYQGQKDKQGNLFWGLWFSSSNSIDDGSSGSTAITSACTDFNSCSILAPSGTRSANTFEKLLYNNINNACMCQ